MKAEQNSAVPVAPLIALPEAIMVSCSDRRALAALAWVITATHGSDRKKMRCFYTPKPFNLVPKRQTAELISHQVFYSYWTKVKEEDIFAVPFGAHESMNTIAIIKKPLGTTSSRHAAPAPFSFSLVLVVVCLFGVSGGLLWELGLNYDGLSGSAASKIHPFTYLIIIVVGLQAIRSGNVVDYCIRTIKRTPASILLIVAGLALFCQIIAHDGAGMAGAIDTYLGPGLLVMLLAWAGEREMRTVEITLHTLMTINALMALIEFAIDYRFFPYRFDGDLFERDFRSTALQGHPLINATVTSCYLLALLNGRPSLPWLLRLLMIGLQFAALVTFGGRTAIVISIVLPLIYLMTRAKHVLRERIVSLPGAAAVVLLFSAIAVVLVPPLSAGGFFNSLLERFNDDGGSANARLEMFDLFAQIPLHDLIIGPNLDLVNSLRRVSGLEWGIENPIVKNILYQGVAVTLLLVVAVVLFLHEIVGRCQRGIWLPMLAFSIFLMTSETIGGKTTLLAKFAVIVLTMYRPSRTNKFGEPASGAKNSESQLRAPISGKLPLAT